MALFLHLSPLVSIILVIIGKEAAELSSTTIREREHRLLNRWRTRMLGLSRSRRRSHDGCPSHRLVGDPTLDVPVDSSTSFNSFASDVDLGGDSAHPRLPKTFCWAIFADLSGIGRPSVVVDLSSQLLRLSLLRDNLSLLSHLPDPALTFYFFSNFSTIGFTRRSVFQTALIEY